MAIVPMLPGVPALSPLVSLVAPGALTLLQSDTFPYFAASSMDQWGIFSDGMSIVSAESVTGIMWRKDWAISDYHIERGGFESYDKVELPFDCRIRFASGGSPSVRQALLESIAAIAGDLNLYDVVTPEVVYPSVNVKHYDYQRTAMNGRGLLVVDVWCQEIRQSVSEQGGSNPSPSTSQPSGASQMNGGTVQPSQATAPVIANVTGLRAMAPAMALANGEAAL